MSRFTVYVMINVAIFSMLIIMEMLMLLKFYSVIISLLLFSSFYFLSLFLFSFFALQLPLNRSDLQNDWDKFVKLNAARHQVYFWFVRFVSHGLSFNYIVIYL